MLAVDFRQHLTFRIGRLGAIGDDNGSLAAESALPTDAFRPGRIVLLEAVVLKISREVRAARTGLSIFAKVGADLSLFVRHRIYRPRASCVANSELLSKPRPSSLW